MLQDHLDHVRVVGDAELVGDGEQHRVGLGDGLVLGQLLDESIGLVGVAAAEDRPPFRLDVAEVVRVLGAATIATRPPGYLIQIREEALDAGRFRRLVADARRLASTGAAARATERSAERMDDSVGRGTR